MKKYAAILLPLVLLSLCSCVSFFAKDGEKLVHGLTEMVRETEEMTSVCSRFKEVHHRWPTTQEELQTFTTAQKIPFDWARYSQLRFKPRPDGNVEVAMMYAPPKTGILVTMLSPTEPPPKLEISAGLGTNVR